MKSATAQTVLAVLFWLCVAGLFLNALYIWINRL